MYLERLPITKKPSPKAIFTENADNLYCWYLIPSTTDCGAIYFLQAYLPPRCKWAYYSHQIHLTSGHRLNPHSFVLIGPAREQATASREQATASRVQLGV